MPFHILLDILTHLCIYKIFPISYLYGLSSYGSKLQVVRESRFLIYCVSTWNYRCGIPSGYTIETPAEVPDFMFKSRCVLLAKEHLFYVALC